MVIFIPSHTAKQTQKYISHFYPINLNQLHSNSPEPTHPTLTQPPYSFFSRHKEIRPSMGEANTRPVIAPRWHSKQVTRLSCDICTFVSPGSVPIPGIGWLLITWAGLSPPEITSHYQSGLPLYHFTPLPNIS